MQEFIIPEKDEPKVAEIEPTPVTINNFSENFFPYTNVSVLFNQLKTFIDGLHNIAIVQGPRSSGKTTVLKKFYEKQANICHWIQASQKTDLYQLFLNQFGFDPSDLKNHSLPFLLQVISNTQPGIIVLIIDDADALALENFKNIIMAFSQNPSPKIKVILVGDSLLEKRITDLSDEKEVPYINYQLGPLNFKETKQYLIKHLCPEMRWNPKQFPKKVLKEIFRLSEGYIGRVNRITMQFAVDKKKFSPKKGTRSIVDLLLTIGILFLLGIFIFRIVIITIYDKEVSPPKKTVTLKPSPPVVKTPIKTIQENIMFDIQNTPAEIPSIENLPEELLVTSEETPLLTIPEPEHTLSQKELTLPHKLTPSSNRFTLHLQGSHEKKALQTWIKNSNLKGLKILNRKKSGKNWYVIAYGEYGSREEAATAMSQLPKQIKKHHPQIHAFTSS